MVKTKIVPKEDMTILRKYLSGESIVLIDEAMLSELTEEQAAYVRKNDGRYANYGFGGEADMLVDLVQSSDHCFMNFLFPEEDEEEEDSEENNCEAGTYDCDTCPNNGDCIRQNG